MEKIALILRTKTKPGQRDAVRRLYEQQLAPRALANAAQAVVVWCDDLDDLDTFYLFEVYRDPAAMQANAAAPWFAGYLQQVAPLLSGEGSMIRATPGWTKGVDV